MIVTILICSAPGCHKSEQFSADTERAMDATVRATKWDIWGTNQICPECVENRDNRHIDRYNARG